MVHAAALYLRNAFLKKQIKQRDVIVALENVQIVNVTEKRNHPNPVEGTI
jgi:hypothetical protein